MKLEVIYSQDYLPMADEAEIVFLLRLLPDLQASKAGYPLDIRYVLDHSGSMGDDSGSVDARGKILSKIEALKAAVCSSLNLLRLNKDKIFIVVFDDSMDIIVDHQVVNNIQDIKNMINAVQTGDRTHLSSPLRSALECSTDKELVRVIIFTDGIVNHPSTASEEKKCLELAKQANKLELPLAVFGTGISYNEHFLKQLAEAAGRGSYFEHVSQLGAMRLRLEEDFENMKSVGDRDVRVEIKTETNVTILSATKYVPQQLDLSVNPKLIHDEFPGLDVRGQSYLIKANVQSRKVIGTVEIGEAVVKWQTPAGPKEEKMELAVNFTDDESLISSVNKTVRNTLLNTEGVKATLQGKYDRAKTLFTTTGNQPMVDQLKTLVEKDEDKKRTLRTIAITSAHKGTIVPDKNKK